jgi:hypothetical protein
MPKPRLDDANIEFDFTQEETFVARSLDPIKIAWLQTKYSKYWKLRNSTPVPEDPILDRSYFSRVAEIDGKLGLIQELLDDHKEAMKEIAEIGGGVSQEAVKTEEATAQRAANLVHRIQT